jgi:hypothetical protein
MRSEPINTPFSEMAGDAATDGMTRLKESPVTQIATPGRIVHYTLSAQDAEAINRRRTDAQREGAGNSGKIVHVGNHASEGDLYPAMVVRSFGGPSVNLQVWLDGNDTYWATSRSEGEPHTPGKWAWPARV